MVTGSDGVESNKIERIGRDLDIKWEKIEKWSLANSCLSQKKSKI